MRAGYIITLLTYVLYLVSDLLVAPVSRQSLLIYRLAVISPILGSFILFSFSRFYRQLGQIVFVVQGIILGILHLILIALFKPGEPGFNAYYVGLILIIYGLGTLGGQLFKNLLISIIIILTGYQYVAIVHQKLLETTYNQSLFLINNLFLFTSAILSLVTNYLLQYYRKKDYIQQIQLQAEREQSEKLLLNILPATVAGQLKHQQKIIAVNFDSVTVLFADIAKFSEITANNTPDNVVSFLNGVFSEFDRLAEKYNIEKIKTIGDAYMAVCGVPVPCSNHAHTIALMALDMMTSISRFTLNGQPIDIRIGISSGPVLAGVIGLKKFAYDLWGDTVNTASRMESHGIPGKIQTSHTSYELLKNEFAFTKRGKIEIKSKGLMPVYLLNGTSSTS